MHFIKNLQVMCSNRTCSTSTLEKLYRALSLLLRTIRRVVFCGYKSDE